MNIHFDNVCRHALSCYVILVLLFNNNGFMNTFPHIKKRLHSRDINWARANLSLSTKNRFGDTYSFTFKL